MASLRVHPDRLDVLLTTAEKALSAHRHDLSIPRACIRSATITHDPWVWIRGIGAPGSYVPLTLAIGTWKNHGGKDFLIVKGKRPAVVLELEPTDDNPYTRVILSTQQLELSTDGTAPKR